jgi:hypothetical protein
VAKPVTSLSRDFVGHELESDWETGGTLSKPDPRDGIGSANPRMNGQTRGPDIESLAKLTLCGRQVLLALGEVRAYLRRCSGLCPRSTGTHLVML